MLFVEQQHIVQYQEVIIKMDCRTIVLYSPDICWGILIQRDWQLHSENTAKDRILGETSYKNL